MPSFCMPVGSPGFGSGKGASPGFNCVRITMYPMMNVANMKPGRKDAVNSALIEVSVISP